MPPHAREIVVRTKRAFAYTSTPIPRKSTATRRNSTNKTCSAIARRLRAMTTKKEKEIRTSVQHLRQLSAAFGDLLKHFSAFEEIFAI